MARGTDNIARATKPCTTIHVSLQNRVNVHLYLMYSGSIVVTTLDCGPGGPWLKSRARVKIKLFSRKGQIFPRGSGF